MAIPQATLTLPASSGLYAKVSPIYLLLLVTMHKGVRAIYPFLSSSCPKKCRTSRIFPKNLIDQIRNQGSLSPAITVLLISSSICS